MSVVHLEPRTIKTCHDIVIRLDETCEIVLTIDDERPDDVEITAADVVVVMMAIVPLHLIAEIVVPIDGGLSHEETKNLIEMLGSMDLDVKPTYMGLETSWALEGQHFSFSLA